MATLATFFKRSDAVAARGERAATVRAESDPFRLRALPNDDIYFYSKRIDNSRVVRQADPAARGECWSAVGAAAVLLMLGLSIIAPHVGAVLAGYKLEALKTEHQSLIDQKRELEVREAALLSPERLNQLAKERNLTSPAGNQIIHLDNPSLDGSFARNQAPQNGDPLSQ
ncbi:MAG TPA: hypothetical protein VHB50_11625 [Bryobacteraceae bacterium]|nr:hypothetical protein [Bryobacteraceae bacterium]